MCREEMKVCVRGITQFHVSSLQARLVSDIFRAYGSRQDPPHCKTPWQQSARASLHTVCAAEMQTHLFKTSWNSAMLTECTPLGFHSLFFCILFCGRESEYWPKDRLDQPVSHSCLLSGLLYKTLPVRTELSISTTKWHYAQRQILIISAFMNRKTFSRLIYETESKTHL